MEEIKQYIFTGTSSTGKTTIMNLMKTFIPKNYIYVNEVTRDLVKSHNIPINELGNDETQEMIFQSYLDFLVLNKNKNYVSDRCIIDPYVYTCVLHNIGTVSQNVRNYQRDIVYSMIENGYLNHIYYFPIEFDNVKDGIRSEDLNFREETDKQFKLVLTELNEAFPNFSFTTIHGNPIERVNQILNINVNESSN